MPKRLWSDTNSPPYSPLTAVRPRGTPPGRRESDERSVDQESHPGQALLPQISRKVKACAACRKQKIKCIMDERGPPCQRCSERNLGCVLNKSLQTIIDEKSQFADAYSQDLDMVYSTVQEVLTHLKMTPMGPLKSSGGRDGRETLVLSPSTNTHSAAQPRHQDSGPSCDNSPKIDPADEGLPRVPIQSLYHLTKISALRSPDANEVDRRPPHAGRDAADDFISRGEISLDGAERLFRLYKDRLDHFMYSIGCRYSTLDELRKKSSILTACIMTVAALHDPQADDIYGICSHEFRRLMANSMFDRLINLDSLRAMCIASYWLSDISWTTSGYAIRRAGEFNLSHSFSRVLAEGTEDAADCLRLWYILYVCDQHLATIYGRSPIVQEDFSLEKCETFLGCGAATVSDTRLVSQVSLLLIFSKIRGVFGPYAGSSISHDRIASFEFQLDEWFGKWYGEIQEHSEFLGGFPRKGAILHLHFAKLYLHSHVFSGLRGSPVPPRFQDFASAAVTEAKSIINLLLTDQDLILALNGIPSYLHSMTAFACMFLVSVSTKHGAALVDPVQVHDLITRLVKMFRSIRTGKWHLVCLMAGGLESVLEKLLRQPAEPPRGEELPGSSATNTRSADIHNGMLTDWTAEPPLTGGPGGLDGSPFFDMNFGISPLLRFDPSVLDFGSSGNGF